MQEDRLEYPSHHDLLQRLAKLEATVRHMQRRRCETRAVSAMAILAVLTGLTLGAKGASGPSGQSIVRAPFQIVGSGGQTLLSVTEAAPGSGKLEMKSAAGKSFAAGFTSQGDSFGRWDGATGSAYIGAPPGKDFGIRLFAAGTNNTTIAMSETNKSAAIGIGMHGTVKVSMRVEDNSGTIGVLDNPGKSYLSYLTTTGGGGGVVNVSNSSGQIVAFMDANPNSNEGRAVFTNAGGEPLAKIGAAGPHGDVLLSGPNKAVAVWEMALTGMMR